MIDEMGRQHAGIRIQHVDALAGNAEFRELKARNVDLMFARLTGQIDAADFDVEILFHESFHVVAGAESVWAKRRKIDLASLMAEPWILQTPGNPIRAQIDKAFRKHGLESPRECVGSVSVHLRTHLIATGKYLTVMPASALKFNANTWALTPLPIDLGILVPTGIVTLKNRTLSPIVSVFIENARAVARAMNQSQ